MSTLPKLKVLYITGWGRSGTTILGSILGQIQGFFYAGEVMHLGDMAWKNNDPCGCGKPCHECEVWSAVAYQLEAEEGRGAMERLATIERQGLRTRHLPTVLGLARSGLPIEREMALIRLLTRVYMTIHEVTGAKWIVDSSKSPAYGRMLQMIPGAHIYVLHLIRDPRATAFSWKKREYPPGARRYLARHGVFNNSIMWLGWNLFIEALWSRDGPWHKYHRLLYEDFAQTPNEAIRRIVSFAGLPEAEVPVNGNGNVEIAATHSVAGNPVRLVRGTVAIRPDEEWRKRMGPHHKAPVVALTWPLLLRYGYPLWA